MDDGRSTLRLDDDNPWPGLAAYDEASQRFFHGRERETAELLRLIRLSPFVTLYGKSGLGKSSMLQAGLFPQLRAERFLPVYLRLDFTEHAEMPPLAQAALRLRQEIDAAGADAPPMAAGESLWAYLQRRERPIWTRDNYPLTPVLVFDQFEEVFSRGGAAAHVEDVLDGMADLVGDRLSADLAEDRDVARRLNLQSQQYRVLLSFRSDFLAEVENWEKEANLPKRESLHLTAMTREGAIEAMTRAGAAVLEPGVAEQIVDFLLTRDDAAAPGRLAEVEPVLMSLCCFQLNSRRKRPAKIDSALLHDVGDNILQGFYAEALAGMPASVSTFIEDNLIQGRYRSSYPRDAALDSGALSRDQLNTLTHRRLLRVDPQGEVPRIELIHDRLVGVVRDARDARLALEQKQREQAEAEDRARSEREEQQRRHEEAAQRARVERERERAEQAERERSRVARWRNGLVVALVALAAASVKLYDTAGRAQESSRRAQALRLVVESQAMLSGAIGGGDARAFQQLLAARELKDLPEVEGGLLDALMARQHLRRFAPVVVADASDILVVAFSPAQRLFATGQRDGSVALRSMAEPQKLLARVAGHSERIQALAFSTDGQRLVSGAEDGSLRRWSVTEAALATIGDPAWHAGPVNAAAFSPDGALVVSGGDDGTVRLWDAQSGEPAGEPLQLEAGPVWGVAFNPDPKSPDRIAVAAGARPDALATGSKASKLILLDGERPQMHETRSLFAHADTTRSVAFSPDGAQVATGGQDDVLRVRDLGGEQSAVRMGGHKGDVLSVAFSPDGLVVASGSQDQTVRLWRVASGDVLGQPLGGPEGAVTSVSFSPASPAGRWLAAAGEDGKLRLWSIEALSPGPGNAKAADKTAADSLRVESVALNGQGTQTALGRSDGSVLLRDGAPGMPDRVLPMPPEAAGPALATCRAAAEGASGIAGDKPLPAATSLAFSADGRGLYVGYRDGRLQHWDAKTGQPLGQPLRATDCALTALAWSADGRRLAVGSDGQALLLDAASGALQRKLAIGHAGGVTALALSADGSWLASAGAEVSLQLRETRDGAEEATRFEGLLGAVHSLAFSPDDAFLVSGNVGGNLRVWDRHSRHPLGRPIEAHRGRTAAIAFAPDGQHFASAGIGGMVRSWPAPQAWPAQMCAKLSFNLSRRAWKESVSRELPYRCQCPRLPIEPDEPGSTAVPEQCATVR